MAFLGESVFPAINQGTGLVPTAATAIQPTGSTTDATQSNAPASSQGTQGTHGNPITERQAPPSAYAWLLAWGVLLAFIALVNRTRVGHAAIYYGLLLLLFFVILSNYRFIQTALNPFSTLGQGNQGG